MKVAEYAKQTGKTSKGVLAVIDELNRDVPDGEEPSFTAGNANSNLTDDEIDLLNGYFGFTPFDPEAPKKIIPMRRYEVVATRLKGKGPALLKAEKDANDEQDAIRQLISERGLKVNYYRFRARKIKDLGDFVRTQDGQLVPAA